MGSRVERTHGKVVAGGLGWARLQLVDPARQQLVEQAVPHSCADKPGGTTGERDRPLNPGLQRREIKPQTSDLKHLWRLRWQWKKLPASQETVGETHGVLERTQADPLGNRH